MYLGKISTNINDERIYLAKYLFEIEYYYFKNEDSLDYRKKNIGVYESIDERPSTRRTKELPEELCNIVFPKYVYYIQRKLLTERKEYFFVLKNTLY